MRLIVGLCVVLWVSGIYALTEDCDKKTDCRIVEARPGDNVSLLCLPHGTLQTWCLPTYGSGLLFKVAWRDHQGQKLEGLRKLKLKRELGDRSLLVMNVQPEQIQNYSCHVKIYDSRCCNTIKATDSFYRDDGKLSDVREYNSKVPKYYGKVPKECRKNYKTFEGKFIITQENAGKNLTQDPGWVRSVLYFGANGTGNLTGPNIASPGLKDYEGKKLVDFDEPKKLIKELTRIADYLWQVKREDSGYVYKVAIIPREGKRYFTQTCAIDKGFVREGRISEEDDLKWTITPFKKNATKFEISQERWSAQVSWPDLPQPPVAQLECTLRRQNGSYQRILLVDVEPRLELVPNCSVILKLGGRATNDGQFIVVFTIQYDFSCGRGYLLVYQYEHHMTYQDTPSLIGIVPDFKFDAKRQHRTTLLAGLRHKLEYRLLEPPMHLIANRTFRVPASPKKNIHPLAAPRPIPVHSENNRKMPKPWILVLAILPVLVTKIMLAILIWIKCRRADVRVVTVSFGKGLDVGVEISGCPENDIEIRPEVLINKRPPTNNPIYGGYLIPKTKWEIDRTRLVLGNAVGQGHFGKVYSGVLDGGTKVAVKTLLDVATEIDLANLLCEIALMRYLGDHPNPNVIRLKGSLTQGTPYGIVTDFAENGSLLEFIRKNWGTDSAVVEAIYPQTLFTMVNFSLDIAHGMEFLAAKQIVHRDLAARNVLIDGGGNLLVADFGLTRWTGDSDYYRMNSQVSLPVRWMACESLHSGKFSTKSDVWSFGVTVWEIFSAGEIPYSAFDNLTVQNHMLAGGRLEKPGKMSPEMYSLLKHTWQENPDHRPTFTQLAMTLSSMLEGMGDQDDKWSHAKENHYV